MLLSRTEHRCGVNFQGQENTTKGEYLCIYFGDCSKLGPELWQQDMLRKIRFWDPRFMVPSTQFAQAISPKRSNTCVINLRNNVLYLGNM